MKEITIISEDRPGVIAEISEALAAANCNIETLASQAIGNSAITVLTTNDYDATLKALSHTPFQAVSEEALVVHMDDVPGALARITRRLTDANINLSAIRILRRGGGKCIVAIAMPRTQQSLELLKDSMVR